MANPCKFQIPGEDRWMTEDEFKQRLSEGLLDKFMVDNNLSFRGIKPDRALAESYGRKTPTSKTSAEKIADKIRSGKIDTRGMAMMGIVPPQVLNAALEGVALTVETVGKVIEKIKESDWFKSLSDSSKPVMEREIARSLNNLVSKPTYTQQDAVNEAYITEFKELYNNILYQVDKNPSSANVNNLKAFTDNPKEFIQDLIDTGEIKSDVYGISNLSQDEGKSIDEYISDKMSKADSIVSSDSKTTANNIIARQYDGNWRDGSDAPFAMSQAVSITSDTKKAKDNGYTDEEIKEAEEYLLDPIKYHQEVYDTFSDKNSPYYDEERADRNLRELNYVKSVYERYGVDTGLTLEQSQQIDQDAENLPPAPAPKKAPSKPRLTAEEKQAKLDQRKADKERLKADKEAKKKADKDFGQKVAEVTGTAKPEKTVQMTPGEALKKQIRDLNRGGKMGQKALQDIKKQVRDYAQENLPPEKYSKSEVKGIMNAITNSTESNIDKVIDRIDKLVEKKEGQKASREEKAAEAKRVQTARDIAKMVKDKRTLLTKVNNKWRGKATVESQKEFKEFVNSGALDNLDVKTQEELDAIKEVLDSIVDTGKADFKRVKEIQATQRRKENAELLEGLVAGTNIGRKEADKIKPTILNSQEEVEDFLSKGGSVIIDGELYTKSSFNKWKSANSNVASLKENLEDIKAEKTELTNALAERVKEVVDNGGDIATDTEYNDLKNAIDTRNKMIADLNSEIKEARAEGETVEDLENIKGYEQRNMTLVKEAELPANQSRWKRLKMGLNPINAINDVYSLLEKATAANSKVRIFIKNNIAAPIQEAYVNKLEETAKKINQYNEELSDIFGSEKKAINRLSEVPEDLEVISDRAAQNVATTNSHIVSYYNLSKIEAVEGKRSSGIDRLEKSGVDVKKVRDYIESNPDLKQYADLLMEKYNDFKSDYEPVYELYSDMPLPEGTYYPEYASNYEEDFIDLDKVMDKDGNFDALSAVSNNMKQRTTFNGQYNLRMDAHRTMLDYIKNMEHARQFMPIAKSTNQLFNKQNAPYLVEALGAKNYNELREDMAVILSDQTPKSIVSEYSNAMNRVANLSVLGTLGFKPASIVKQFTAFTHFWTAGIKDGVDPISVIKGTIPKTADELEFFNYLRNSEYMKDRLKGGSIDIEMKRILDEASKSTEAKVWDGVMRVAMSPIRAGDAAAILYSPGGGTSFAIAMYRKKLADGMSKEEARDYAYKRFVTEAERTQQSTRNDITSNIQRDPIFRMMGMYRTGQMSMSKKVINGARTLINANKMEKNEGLAAREKAISDDEIAQATVDIIYYTLFGSLAFAAVSSGSIKVLQDVFGDSGYDEDDKKRMYYDLVMDQINSDLQGYGAMGFFADWILNTVRGDDWKNTIPALKSIKNIQDAVESLPEVVGRDWSNIDDKKRNEFIKEGDFLNQEGVSNQWSVNEYEKLKNDWDNQFLWGRMTDAEKQTAVKAIGGGNLRTTYNNFAEAIEGNKTWSDAIMNWEEDYFKIAREKNKRDKIFEWLYGEPYIMPEEYKQGPTKQYIPDFGVPGNGDLFQGIPMDESSDKAPQSESATEK